MSIYSTAGYIDNYPAQLPMRGGEMYSVRFDADKVSLDQIKNINWAKPEIKGLTLFPEGFGFILNDVKYHFNDNTYEVVLKAGKQYYGNIEAHVAANEELTAQLNEANETIKSKDSEISTLNNQLIEADEALVAMFEAQAAEKTVDEPVEESTEEPVENAE